MERMKCPFVERGVSDDDCPYMMDDSTCADLKESPKADDSYCGDAVEEALE